MEGANDDKGDKKEEERGNGGADERDWRQLLPELLNVIYEQLPDFLDCIYFRATCKAWNLPVPLPDATPCHPWLFNPYNSYDRTIRFYAFTSNATISIPTGEFNRTSRRSMYLSTLTGWMFYYQHETSSYYFINPLTGIYGDFIAEMSEEGQVPSSHVLRVSRAQEGFVFSILPTTANLLERRHAHLLTLQWVRNGVQQENVRWSIKGKRAGYELYKGKYFISSGFVDEDIKALDATSNEPLYQVTLPAIEPPSLPGDSERMRRQFNYLMESSGELLLIIAITYIRSWPKLRSRYVFDVYRLEDKDVDSHWTKMTAIGDRAMFLNEFDGFSLESSQYPRLKKNSIYFMRSTTKRVSGDDADDNPFNNNRTLIIASRYDLETGLLEDFPYTMNYWGSWYLPSFQSCVHGINADGFPDYD